jgi:GMP synthase (glutamine-hydrolysing)
MIQADVRGRRCNAPVTIRQDDAGSAGGPAAGESPYSVSEGPETMSQIGQIAILDLGGQYCHLISRRLRDLRIDARILPPDAPAESLREYAGIILSGGPRSVYEQNAPAIDAGLLDLGRPVLGICYGHQLLAQHLGGTVTPGDGEYGLSDLTLIESDSLFRGTPPRQSVWMSHADSVSGLPAGYVRLAATGRCENAAFVDPSGRFFGVQFHPEVTHSTHGRDVLRNFCVELCGITPAEDVAARVPALEEAIRRRVGDDSVFFLVSGGVDSSVAFTLCAKALPPERVLGLYVDTGLMRKGETAELQENFERLGLASRLRVRDESRRFLGALAGVVDPEEKRHIIGRLFVEVQGEAMRDYGIDAERWLLGQGTIYPDTIESGGAHGRAALIKTHHNRCAEILELRDRGRVIEPLAELYKDEVREVGRELGLGPALTHRWPFPGPGLAIRCLCSAAATGALSAEATGALGAEAIIAPSAAEAIDLGGDFADFQGARLPLRSVGVQGDGRTYRSVVAVRGPWNYDRIQRLSNALCNATTVYNRVVLALNDPGVPLAEGRLLPATLTVERLDLLREADHRMRLVMRDHGLTDAVWQFPVVLLPMSFGGGETVVLRPVNSVDGMTANFARLPHRVLQTLVASIAALEGVGLVCLDVTDKPPATIEWE